MPAPRPHRPSAILAGACLALSLFAGACSDKTPPPPKVDGRSVIEGGKAESAAGRKVEDAKREIDGAEKKMQDRADDVFEKSGGEKVERGVP
jgi:hypothetical protein